ncbi:MAG: sigma factor [Comamonas sp.]
MIERYYRELLGYFSRRAGGSEHAADIVQEAYSRVIAVQQSGRTSATRCAPAAPPASTPPMPARHLTPTEGAPSPLPPPWTFDAVRPPYL